MSKDQNFDQQIKRSSIRSADKHINESKTRSKNNELVNRWKFKSNDQKLDHWIKIIVKTPTQLQLNLT